jgi:hypothetical protein
MLALLCCIKSVSRLTHMMAFGASPLSASCLLRADSDSSFAILKPAQPVQLWPRVVRSCQLHCACRQISRHLLQAELSANPSQPPGNRTAAAFALIRSQLLRWCTYGQAHAVHGCDAASLMQLSLRGWTVALSLLEDEDDAVRCPAFCLQHTSLAFLWLCGMQHVSWWPPQHAFVARRRMATQHVVLCAGGCTSCCVPMNCA